MLLVAHEVAFTTDAGWLIVRLTLAIVLVLLGERLVRCDVHLALAVASAGTDSAERQTSRVYAANTLGAVAGALAGGFVLVPRFGLQTTFLLASVLLLAGGITIVSIGAAQSAQRRSQARRICPFCRGRRRDRRVRRSPLDRDLITSGAYKSARQISTADLEWSLRAGQLEYYGKAPLER